MEYFNSDYEMIKQYRTLFFILFMPITIIIWLQIYDLTCLDKGIGEDVLLYCEDHGDDLRNFGAIMLASIIAIISTLICMFLFPFVINIFYQIWKLGVK